jgi:hypothetical protein
LDAMRLCRAERIVCRCAHDANDYLARR